jgi:hypothetical protein
VTELWRRTRWLVACLLGYAVLFLLLALLPRLFAMFGRLPTDYGLLTPDGQVHLASALLTGAVLIGRLIALFVVVPLLVYRVIRFC